MNLHVKLRDGFRNDTVTVRVNGQRVYQKSGVSTDLTISHADSIDIQVQAAAIELEVSVEGGQTVSRPVQVQETPFIEVWNTGGRLELRASGEETPML